MSKNITASELVRLQTERAVQLVDICSPGEYAAGHVPGAINIPMEQLEARLADLSATAPLVLICKSGQRARATAQLLDNRRDGVMVLDGGARAWSAQGGTLVVNTKTRWSLERQVRLGAGLLVLTGAVLSLVWDSRCIALSAFVGLGLTFAGVTDICGMALLLSKMPWNKVRQAPTRDAANDHECVV